MEWLYWAATLVVPKQYKVMSNQHNIYKTYIHTFSLLESDEKKYQFIDNIRVEAGNEVLRDFKQYVFDHIPRSDILKYM